MLAEKNTSDKKLRKRRALTIAFMSQLSCFL